MPILNIYRARLAVLLHISKTPHSLVLSTISNIFTTDTNCTEQGVIKIEDQFWWQKYFQQFYRAGSASEPLITSHNASVQFWYKTKRHKAKPSLNRPWRGGMLRLPSWHPALSSSGVVGPMCSFLLEVEWTPGPCAAGRIRLKEKITRPIKNRTHDFLSCSTIP